VQQFGKLFTIPVQGQISGQILYVPNLTIPGKGVHNVIYVTTMHNLVYAFDADDNEGLNADPLWGPVSLGNPVSIATLGPLQLPYGPCPGVPGQKEKCNTAPEIGVLSTPVIDDTTGTLYVVAKTQAIDGSLDFSFQLHALDILTGITGCEFCKSS